MRYFVWMIAIVCQVSNLICVTVITRKKDLSSKTKRILLGFSIVFQIIAIVVLSYLVFTT